MKTTFSFFALLLISFVSMSQQINPPLNLTWLCSKQIVSNTIGIEHHYKTDATSTNCSDVAYSDVVIGTHTYMLFMGVFYKNQMVKAVLATEVLETYRQVNDEYDRLYETFVAKYGEPYFKTWSFTTPYYEGDGYEMQALRNDKLNVFVAWKDEFGNFLSLKLMPNTNGNAYFSITYEHKYFADYYVPEAKAAEASGL